jgi:hypothetical protein
MHQLAGVGALLTPSALAVTQGTPTRIRELRSGPMSGLGLDLGTTRIDLKFFGRPSYPTSGSAVLNFWFATL